MSEIRTVNDVRDGGEVGMSVHESDQTCAGIDQGAQGRPGGVGQIGGSGGIGHGIQADRLEDACEVGGREAVRVDDEQGDD